MPLFTRMVAMVLRLLSGLPLPPLLRLLPAPPVGHRSDRTRRTQRITGLFQRPNTLSPRLHLVLQLSEQSECLQISYTRRPPSHTTALAHVGRERTRSCIRISVSSSTRFIVDVKPGGGKGLEQSL